LSDQTKSGAAKGSAGRLDRASGLLQNDSPLAEIRTLGGDRAAALLREVATQLIEQADEIADTMLRAYDAEIPTYSAAITDQAMREDVHVVSSAMVRCWLTVMSTGEAVTPELLRPMTEGARRRAAQGIDLQSMLRAYRVGIRVMWSEITASPVWRREALQGALAQVATWALDFADKISTAVAAAYLEETEQLAREREHRRSALLNVILSGPVAEPIDRPADLDRRHSVVVARVVPDLSLFELEQTGQLLEERAGALLWTVRHRSVVAAVAWPAGLTRDQLARRLGRLVHEGQIVAIGLGGSAEGVTETRESYAEAIAALRVGPLVGTAMSPVYDFLDLAPLIALLERPEAARRFAQSVLEPLGELVQRPWLLPTLEAYLVNQGRLKQAAADLGVHMNTVKYRLKGLRAFTDPLVADGTRATTLLLALRVLRLLESEVASRPATGGPKTAEEEDLSKS
jgi:hypothetical protein